MRRMGLATSMALKLPKRREEEEEEDVSLSAAGLGEVVLSPLSERWRRDSSMESPRCGRLASASRACFRLSGWGAGG